MRQWCLPATLLMLWSDLSSCLVSRRRGLSVLRLDWCHIVVAVLAILHPRTPHWRWLLGHLLQYFHLGSVVIILGSVAT